MNFQKACGLTLCLGLASSARAGAAGSVKVPDEPARIEILVAPATGAAPAERVVTLKLTPAAGIHINRYPKMRLKVEAQKGLTQLAEAAVGNDEPPPPDKLEANYYDKTVDPIQLPLRLDPAAGAGPYELSGQLTYYYCVTASGFCAPKKVPVKIPISSR